ncbi:hypothetical protein BKA64DRAFT_618559 [Cadophora sp. MPI-SDFR-AT-0126]|nr:hypothetical protein BKA64DRAFT_618559 [Leotiomycetes sp. MPI-SDFR-AT-0126]
MELYSIFFGLFMGLFVFTTSKVVQQTQSIWKRTRSLRNIYLYMIWTEAIVNLIFSITTYLYLCGVIPLSFAFLFAAVLLWAIQTQLLSQIIANRVALIMVNKRKSRLLKLGLFIFIGIVNISVFYIWIMAHLPSASPRMVVLNQIWERIEKSFFLIIDCGLNLYFLYLVRYRLIAHGLSKYWRLFYFNAAILLVSVSMDILLLGMLSLPNPYDYVQFAPVAYIIKLHIELTMAVLISKVVRDNNAERVDDGYSSGHHTSNRTNVNRSTNPYRFETNVSGGKASGPGDVNSGAGILKTVTAVVKSDSDEETCGGYELSTKSLTEEFPPYNSSVSSPP